MEMRSKKTEEGTEEATEEETEEETEQGVKAKVKAKGKAKRKKARRNRSERVETVAPLSASTSLAHRLPCLLLPCPRRRPHP
jgi:hypothetical protein